MTPDDVIRYDMGDDGSEVYSLKHTESEWFVTQKMIHKQTRDICDKVCTVKAFVKSSVHFRVLKSVESVQNYREFQIYDNFFRSAWSQAHW